MSEYYYNEKTGRYESADESRKQSEQDKGVFSAEKYQEWISKRERPYFEKHLVESQPGDKEAKRKRNRGIGCVVAIIIIIAAVGGVIAFSFVATRYFGNSFKREFSQENDTENETVYSRENLDNEFQAGTETLTDEESEQAYLKKLEESKEEIMSAVKVLSDGIHYDSKFAYGEGLDSGMHLLFNREGDEYSNLAVVYYTYGVANDFDRLSIMIDGEVLSQIIDRNEKMYDEYGGSEYEAIVHLLEKDMLKDNAKLIYGAKEVVLTFDNTDTDIDDSFEYVFTKEDKLTFRHVFEAYQLLTGEFIHDFSAYD